MKKSKLHRLIEAGANVIGTTSAAAATMAAASPELGLALTAVSATGVYQKVGTEMADRWLGPREKARVGWVLAKSVEMLESELKQGKTASPRTCSWIAASNRR